MIKVALERHLRIDRLRHKRNLVRVLTCERNEFSVLADQLRAIALRRGPPPCSLPGLLHRAATSPRGAWVSPKALLIPE